jgi:hypothetical protein
MLSEVPAQPEPHDLRVTCGEIFDHLPRPIGTSVIDEDQLEASARTAKRLHESPTEFVEMLLVAVDRNDD